MKYMLLFSGTEEAIPAELDKELYQKAFDRFDKYGKQGRILERLKSPRVSR